MRRVAGIILATLLVILAIVGSRMYSIEGLEYLIAMYVMYIAYEIVEFHKVVSSIRPFLVALTVYFAIIIVSMNLPDVAFYIKPIKGLILPFLLSLALVRFELPTKFQPIITTIGLTLTAIFGYELISSLPVGRSEDIALSFTVLLLILAITTILPSVHERFEFLRRTRSFIISAGVIVSLYYVLVRPLLTDRPGLMNVFDWVIVAGIFLKGGSILRKELIVDESEIVKLHEYRVSVRREEIVEAIERAKREFVERGIKSPLIAVLCKVLFTAGWSVDEVARVVSYIIAHEDAKIPKLSFPWERRMIEKKNRKMRKKVLEEVRRYLEGIGVGLGGVQKEM